MLLFFEKGCDFGSSTMQLEFMKALPTGCYGFMNILSEFIVKINIGINALHGEINISKMVFEQLFVLLVRNVSSYFLAQIVEDSFSNV